MLCQVIHKCQHSCPYFNFFFPLSLFFSPKPLTSRALPHSPSSQQQWAPEIPWLPFPLPQAPGTGSCSSPPAPEWAPMGPAKGEERHSPASKGNPLHGQMQLSSLLNAPCKPLAPSSAATPFEGVKTAGVTEHDLSWWPGGGFLRGTSWVPTHYENCLSMPCILE